VACPGLGRRRRVDHAGVHKRTIRLRRVGAPEGSIPGRQQFLLGHPGPAPERAGIARIP
jgi:hypothetical protein